MTYMYLQIALLDSLYGARLKLVMLFFFGCIKQASDVSVFETTIRFLGGLLSAYAFSGDEVSEGKYWTLMIE